MTASRCTATAARALVATGAEVAVTVTLPDRCTQAGAPAHEHVRRAAHVAKALLGDVRGAVGEPRAPAHGLREALEAVTTGLPSLNGLTGMRERVEALGGQPWRSPAGSGLTPG